MCIHKSLTHLPTGNTNFLCMLPVNMVLSSVRETDSNCWYITREIRREKRENPPPFDMERKTKLRFIFCK